MYAAACCSQVLEGHRQYVEVVGNMQPLTKSTEPLYVGFRPFRENRLPLVVRLRDLKAEPAGQVVFFPAPRTADTSPTPICALNVVLPGHIGADAQTPDLEVSEIQLSEALKLAAPGTCCLVHIAKLCLLHVTSLHMLLVFHIAICF